jgi:hypothetical protein
MKIRRSLLKDTVSVQTYTGESAYGPVYAAATSARVNVDATRRLVRNAAGEEVVSEATLYVHPNDAALFVPESRVSIGDRLSTVLGVSVQTFRGSDAFAKVSCS